MPHLSATVGKEPRRPAPPGTPMMAINDGLVRDRATLEAIGLTEMHGIDGQTYDLDGLTDFYGRWQTAASNEPTDSRR